MVLRIFEVLFTFQETRMRKFLYVLGSIAVVLGLAALLGSTLPVKHVARRSATFGRPVNEVWGVLTDFKAQPSWRTDVTAASLVRDGPGGAIWREDGSSALTLQTTEAVAPTRLVRTIADPTLPFGGRWIYELAPAANDGTVLTITEDGEVYNPVFRLISKLTNQAATIEGYLNALGAKFGDVPVIEKR